jgi:hypothetical protein
MAQNRQHRVGIFVGGLVVGVMLAAQAPVFATTNVNPCAVADDTTASAPAEDHSESTSATAPETEVVEAETVMTASTVIVSLRLSELLPNPVGTDTEGEFIEVQNFGAQDAGLAGWKITNPASGKTFVLPNVTIAAGGWRQFPYVESRLQLSNSGGTISLVAPDETAVDTVTYGSAADGKSYARAADGAWGWNRVPTPGAANDQAGFAANDEPRTVTATAYSSSGTSSPTAEADAVTSTVAVPVAVITAAPTFSKADISITSFLPRPASGGSEWIELENSGPVAATLTGWHLDDIDGGSKPFALDGVTLAAGERRRFTQAESHLGLNDDGDEVRLMAADGSLASHTSYVKAPLGQTRLSIEGIWLWENESSPEPAPVPTPEETTAAPTVGNEADTSTETPADAPTGTVQEIATQQAVTLSSPKGGLTEIMATVTLPPGKVGSNTFAAMADGGLGLFVRVYGSPVPVLARGDRLQMSAKVSAADGIATATVRAKDMVVVGHGAVPKADETSAFSPTANGRVVLLRGTVTGGGKHWLTVSQEGLDDEVRVTLLTGEVPVGNQEGSVAEVSGVARLRNGKVELLAEGDELKLTPATTASAAGFDEGPVAVTTSPEKKKSTGASLPAVVTPIGGVAASAYAIWRKRRGLVDIPS